MLQRLQRFIQKTKIDWKERNELNLFTYCLLLKTKITGLRILGVSLSFLVDPHHQFSLVMFQTS